MTQPFAPAVPLKITDTTFRDAHQISDLAGLWGSYTTNTPDLYNYNIPNFGRYERERLAIFKA